MTDGWTDSEVSGTLKKSATTKTSKMRTVGKISYAPLSFSILVEYLNYLLNAGKFFSKKVYIPEEKYRFEMCFSFLKVKKTR